MGNHLLSCFRFWFGSGWVVFAPIHFTVALSIWVFRRDDTPIRVSSSHNQYYSHKTDIPSLRQITLPCFELLRLASDAVTPGASVTCRTRYTPPSRSYSLPRLRGPSSASPTARLRATKQDLLPSPAAYHRHFTLATRLHICQGARTSLAPMIGGQPRPRNWVRLAGRRPM